MHEDMICEVKNVIYVMRARAAERSTLGNRQLSAIHNQQIRDRPSSPHPECCDLVGTSTNV